MCPQPTGRNRLRSPATSYDRGASPTASVAHRRTFRNRSTTCAVKDREKQRGGRPRCSPCASRRRDIVRTSPRASLRPRAKVGGGSPRRRPFASARRRVRRAPRACSAAGQHDSARKLHLSGAVHVGHDEAQRRSGAARHERSRAPVLHRAYSRSPESTAPAGPSPAEITASFTPPSRAANADVGEPAAARDRAPTARHRDASTDPRIIEPGFRRGIRPSRWRNSALVGPPMSTVAVAVEVSGEVVSGRAAVVVVVDWLARARPSKPRSARSTCMWSSTELTDHVARVKECRPSRSLRRSQLTFRRR